MVKNSCIFYLVNNNPIHLSRLYKSLELLHEHFLSKYPYPIVFGHENLPNDIKNTISAGCPGKHYFYNVNFKTPDYSQDILDKIPEKFKGHWDENAYFSMGYRHMCRFYAGDMYKHEFFSNVKYLWRLDCDSYITGPLAYDPFEVMEKNNAVYGYKSVEDDMDYVIEGLEEFTSKFFGDAYPLFIEETPNRMYSTHFEIVDFQAIKKSLYMDYFNAIDKTGNIYIKRWGDAPIKYKGINALFPAHIYWFANLPYKHGGDF